MSSGYGIRGGIGRCYPFFAEFRECLKTETSITGENCQPIRDDYFECLHHGKEYDLVKKVHEQAALNEKKAAAGGGGDGHH